MRQLLTWCGSRALPEKPSGNVKDANAIMAGRCTDSSVTVIVLTKTSARAIQQELIDEFTSKPDLSDWFSRVCCTPYKVRDVFLLIIRRTLYLQLWSKSRTPLTKRTRQH
jgi:hypothetical protein